MKKILAGAVAALSLGLIAASTISTAQAGTECYWVNYGYRQVWRCN